MAKKTNTRCPLQSECKRKCDFEGHELDCDYYRVNGIGNNVIEDQEEIREEQERKRQAEIDEALMAELESTPNIVYVPIEQLHPHPDNPRKELGDLTELADSIRAKGVFQNLTVVPGHWMTQEEWAEISARYKEDPSEELRALMNTKWLETDYTVVIGHRRRAGGKLAGLTQLPCAIVEMTHKEQVETMLLENMQREDLTPYEQALGFQMMIDMGDTVEEIVQKTGFSKKTVKRRLKMAELDPTVLKEVSSRQISMEDFDTLAKIDDISKRNAVLKSIGTNNFDSECKTAIKKQEIHKKLPAAKKVARDLKANKISRNDTYGCEYTKIGSTIKLAEWDGETHPVPEGETRKLFYTLDADWGELAFYVKTPRAKPQKRSKEEIDREKRMAEANAEMARLNELHFDLRKTFVNGLTVGKNNLSAVMQAAVLACTGSSVCYTGSNRSDITAILGMEDTYSQDRGKQLVEAFAKVEPAEYPKLIYHRMGDSATRGYSSTYKGQFPKYQHCDDLDVVYAILTALGYEMSDAEIALRDGTHELFSRT